MSRLSPTTLPSQQFQQQQEPVVPRRLELSLDPTDGSLMTAPLLSVVMAATDGLYNDLYQMAHGELEIGAAQQPSDEQQQDNEDGGGENTAAAADESQQQQQQQQGQPGTITKEKMSSLSFAQRRHELSWRMASHGKVMTQIAALTGAAASTDLSNVARVSTRALQHARTAWVQADEAQDALYFFHAQLFPARQAPHDVYGAVDTVLGKTWYDLPQDLQLTVDRYEQSQEKLWPPREVADQWNMAVRDKLLLGEMGWMELNGITVPWRISLRGGIVRLTHGRPKTIISPGAVDINNDDNDNSDGVGGTTKTTKTMYPLEAVVTVLSTSQPAVWTLVSVEVHAQAKTGQSNHQVDTTNRQRFDLHRLCALAMAREEARAHKEQDDAKEKNGNNNNNNNDNDDNSITGGDNNIVARPLHALFQVAQVFELSWQLEILSAQAQALKQVWGTQNSSIVVTPVQFFENRSILGMVSISFWSVDDRNGPPCMCDLHDSVDEHDNNGGVNTTTAATTTTRTTMIEDDDGQPDTIPNSSSDSVSTVSRSINTPSVTNQLTLSIRAEPNVGVRVALSGAEAVMEFASVQPHTKSTIRELLEATSNPFCLSASEALLAATRLCAERKCHAIVEALREFLPVWVRLYADKGAISVGANVNYYGIETATNSNNSNKEKDYIVLFRLTCDARTGTFAATFARCCKLLQYVACNNIRASSDSTALRLASLAERGRGSAASRGGGGFASGRAVRDAFDGLSRSMNVLGQRTGVGGAWKDNNDMSASLRVRAISMACRDVRVSLVTCCGMAALYGLSAVAVGVATGVAPTPDMAGGIISNLNGISFLQTPPLSVLIDQTLTETASRTSDGEKMKQARTTQELFGICCSVGEEGLTLYGVNVTVQLDTPTAVPNRTSYSMATLKPATDASEPTLIENKNDGENEEPSKKRARLEATATSPAKDLMVEVEKFASILSTTLEL